MGINEKLGGVETQYSPTLNRRSVAGRVWRLHERGWRASVAHRVVGVRRRQNGSDLGRYVVLVLGHARWCCVLVKCFVLGLVGEQDCEVVEVADAVGQRAG